MPQLVMPMTFDQPDNASRLERLGVAETVWPRRFTGPRVAAALDRLLSSESVAVRCAALALKGDAESAVARTCDVIERSEL